jgi:hypothetical protein
MAEIDLGKVKRNVAKMVDMGAPESDIDAYIAEEGTSIDAVKAFKMEAAPKKKGINWQTVPAALKSGIEQGATFGFGDELKAAVAAGTVGLMDLAGADTGGLTSGQSYEQALGDFRGDQSALRQSNPLASIGGEIAGGVLTGGAALNAMKGAGAARQAGTIGQEILRGAGQGVRAGALSGGLYGFGTGEGGVPQRVVSSGAGAIGGSVLGGVGGAVAGSVSGSLAARAARILEKKRASQMRVPSPVSGAEIVQPAGGRTSDVALSKIVDRLRADYPDEAQFQQALKAYESGQGTLAELGGGATQDLALGSAQYPGGKGVITEFFQGKPAGPGQPSVGGAVSEARGNVTAALEKGVSGNKDFFETLDDIVQSGQKKAAPLYKKANEKLVELSDDILTPEVKSAISSARKSYPSELDGLPDNSVKVLDYAKRVLDDEINTAQRSGQNNFARSRTDIKNNLIAEIDRQVPVYAKARKKAGDYLSIKSAMEKGRQFKGKPEDVARQFKKLGDQEKEAFRMGAMQKLREDIDAVKDAGNAYSKVFGSQGARAKIKAILPEEQFKQLEKDLWASDRIYKLKDKILGNSTTASKQISAEEFAMPENSFLQDLSRGRPIDVASQKLAGWVSRKFDGLSDKTAKEVARILTAKSDAERWTIIRQIRDAGNKSVAAKESGARALQVYYELDNMIKPYAGAAPGVSGGSLASQPLRITVPVQGTPREEIQ